MTLNLARSLLLALALTVPPGCAAIRSLDFAASTLDAYELLPAEVPGGARIARSVAVEVSAASAAIATDRILVKPDALSVAYLPGARWIEPAPTHVQSLLIRSLADSGRTGFVGASATGSLPDYVLLSRIDAFQAEIVRGAEPPVRVVVAMTLSVMNDIDGRIIASRRFERSVGAASDDASTVVSAFNVVMSGILREVTAWTIASIAGSAA